MKKFFCSFCTVLFLLSCIFAVPAHANALGLIWDGVEVTHWPFVYPQSGDLDADGKVSVADARLCLRSAVGLETLTDLQKQALSAMGIANADTATARTVLRMAVGLEDPSVAQCTMIIGREAAFGPFANAGSGMYNWECEVQGGELTITQITEELPDAVTGTPVQQYFLVNAKTVGTYRLVFKLKTSWESTSIAEYTVNVTVL